MDYSIVFVCLMGIGTVFFGLICLIAVTSIIGRVFGHSSAKTSPRNITAPVPAELDTSDRNALVAAISAAVAEELGTDVTGIRILSMKKV